MAFEYETPARSAIELPSGRRNDGVDSSKAARLILDALGESQRAGQGGLQQPEAHSSQQTDDRSLGETETLLKDAELVVKATGPATADLLRQIYLSEWLLPQQLPRI